MTRPVLVAVLLVVATATLTADVLRPPGRRLPACALVTAIHLYRATLSPVLAGGGFRCRFEPSCSVYAEVCIRRFGAAAGSVAAARRIIRCGPWTAPATVDPPPGTGATAAPSPPG